MFCNPNFLLPCCISLLDGILICLTQWSWARPSFLPNYVSPCLSISHLKQSSDSFLHAGIKFCNCSFLLCISFGFIMSRHGAATPGGETSGAHCRCWTASEQHMGFLLLQQPPAFPCSIMEMGRAEHRDGFESLVYGCLICLLSRRWCWGCTACGVSSMSLYFLQKCFFPYQQHICQCSVCANCLDTDS